MKKNLVSSVAQDATQPPRRTAPFDAEPGFYEPAKLWLYGNTRLLDSDLALVPLVLGSATHSELELNQIERYAEEIVLAGKTLVTGIHNEAHRRRQSSPFAGVFLEFLFYMVDSISTLVLS